MKKLITKAIVCMFSLLSLVAKAEEGILYTSNQLTSTLITSLVQDHQGFIWIGTQNGLNRFDGYRFTPYLYKKNVPTSLCHNNVTALFVDNDGQLWLGTAKGLARYNAATDDFTHFDIRPDTDDEPRITNIVETPQGTILVGTSGFGLYEVGRHATDIRKTDRYSATDENDYYWGMFFDDQGRFWKTDNSGTIYCFSADKKPRLLLKYKPATGLTFTFLRNPDGSILAISKQGGVVFNAKTLAYKELHTNLATLSSAIIGSDGNLLLGTTGYGLWRYGINDNPREPVIISNPNIDFGTTNVTAVCEDRQHNLWVGCSQRGLLFFPNEQQVFQNWNFLARGVKTSRIVEALAPASDGGLWAALGDGDLYHFSTAGNITRTIKCPLRLHTIHRDRQGNYWVSAGRTLYSFQEESGRLQEVKTFDGDFLFSIGDDGNGHLFLSTFSAGMAVYDVKSRSIRQYSMYQRDDPRGFLCNNWVFRFFLDSKGLMWIATSSGTSCYDPVKDTFKTFGWHNILEGYACLSINEDGNGNILIGTDRGLFVFDRKKNETKPFVGAKEIDNQAVQAVACQPNGDVWMSTSMGIWHYRQKDGELIGHLSGNGLREREYINVFQQMQDGRIVFVNNDGLVAFSPADLQSKQKELGAVVLTSLQIGGEYVSTQSLSNGDIITSEPVSESNYFRLSYLDNSFTMHFSTFDFANVQNLILEYRLNDDNWIQTPNGTGSISFNRLQPGTYHLYVRAVGGDLSSPVSTYTITIAAPWYRTTMAYVIYLLVLLTLAGYIGWRFWRSRQEQLAEEKMQFLINATHDIRTPLTLILSPLHKLMMRKDNDAETTEKLGIIDHNARRILGLVNQILDIRKIDKQQMRLSCQETDLVPYLSQIQKAFAPHAQERNISFEFDHPENAMVWIDRTQFDKVIQNLLSNAFKFTPDGGDITINLQTDNSQLTISVTDTGTGLHEADIPRLFTRFYQSTSNQALGKEGTGIGLNLCKMIVEMHHGTISAQNRTDGIQGSQFIVTLPLGNGHLSSEELKVQSEKLADGSETLKVKTELKGKHHHILLVDDDAEITDYISSELSGLYHFHACQNGKEALHELLSDDRHYDLVVSDIMMPEMDGFTLLRTIKSNTKLSHMPVILLTSEAAVGNRLEGLQRGADAFLAKPFLLDELHVTIDNLLAKSVRLKDKFSGAEEERSEQVEQRDVTDNDKQLMDRIMQSVNKNLGDSYFSVEQLAADAGLSRSQLHRRMKELTGITPSDFIRNLRLEQAARLLRERKANISQVAYTLGFNTPGNFSKAFKQHFGMSPTEYIGNKE